MNEKPWSPAMRNPKRVSDPKPQTAVETRGCCPILKFNPAYILKFNPAYTLKFTFRGPGLNFKSWSLGMKFRLKFRGCIPLGFSLVLSSAHVYKSRSSIREIIPNAHFEKNQFFTKMKVVVDFWAFWLLGGQRFDNSSLTIEARTTGACSSKRACFSDYETPVVF